MADNSAPSQTYHALCHCGAIRFNVKLSPPLQHPEGQTPEWQPMKPLKCSCSICTRAGYLLVYPNKLDVTWEEGSSERVKKYKFHEGAIKEHLFCPECGISLMIDFKDVHRQGAIEKGKAMGEYGVGESWEVLAVSVRSFQGIELNKLEYRELDGINKVGIPYDTAGKWKQIVREETEGKEDSK